MPDTSQPDGLIIGGRWYPEEVVQYEIRKQVHKVFCCKAHCFRHCGFRCDGEPDPLMQDQRNWPCARIGLTRREELWANGIFDYDQAVERRP